MIYKKKNFTGATSKIYDALFDEIIHNKLKPGTPLLELELAGRFQSSRTPVREALVALEGEGIITRMQNKGCFVSEVSTRDVEEIFELRELLELKALRASYELITDEDLEKLYEGFVGLSDNSPESEYYNTDRQLHLMIVNYCGNSRLVDFLGVLNAQIERVRVISAMKPARLTQSKEEHLEIVCALKDRNLPRAEEKLAIHIRNVKESTKQISKILSSMK